ncbi:MAG: DUF4829 domain-containing protein [Clostridium sp.]|nr:DUF4829 domain-containing protein [Clostridium sp.]
MSFSLISCEKENLDSELLIKVSDSSKFTDEEIDDAINTVIDNFVFPEFDTNQIIYDEEKSDIFIIEYLSHGKGSTKDIDPSNIIVLLSDFDVETSAENPILNEDKDISDFSWVLVREDKAAEWKIMDEIN